MLKADITHPDERTLRIELVGTLHNGTEDQLLDLLNQNHAVEAEHLIIDFAGVTFVSSAGIGVIAKLIRSRTPGAEKIRFERVPDVIGKIFRMTRVDQHVIVT